MSKYRPRVPLLLLTDSLEVARSCAPMFGVYVSIVEQLPASRFDVRQSDGQVAGMGTLQDGVDLFLKAGR